VIEHFLRHNTRLISRKRLIKSGLPLQSLSKSVSGKKVLTKVFHIDDENISKGIHLKGAQYQMKTIEKVSNSRLNDIHISREKKTEIKGLYKSNDKYRLEGFIYRLLTAAVLTAGLYFLHIYLNLLIYSIPFLSTAILFISIKMLASIELPSNDLIPIRKKRREIKNFLSHELKFALVLISAVFFMDMAISPLYLGIFLLCNFCLQLILFGLWQKYNQLALNDRQNEITTQYRKNIIIVGASKRGKKAADVILEHPDLNIRILGFVDYRKKNLWRYRDIPLVGHPDGINSLMTCNQVDYVVMAVEPEDFSRSQQIFNMIEQMGINICVLPDIYERNLSKCRASSMNGQPILLYHSCPDNCRLALFLKTSLDKLGALAGLIVSFPILLVSAIAIKLESRGPVFFKQTRSGKNGQEFKMLKLRTMHNGADKEKNKLKHLNEMSGPVFKIKNDPRLTKVGKILRKFSVDEFPQFFNILKGDMSLVGPRPPLPSEVARYEPWQRRKLSVKPGATCLWQINGRNHIDFDKWMKLDLEYIDNWSLKEDVRILLKTVPAVLKGNGAS